MRIAIIGQQEFGKAVFHAFRERGYLVAGVFCVPESPGARPDPLRLAAEQSGVKVFQPNSLQTYEAREILGSLDVELGVMAYVLQFAPQHFVTIPIHGTIQYHPSFLPRYRGPSSINWPIIRGDTRTGLTVFRPTDGLDEGPVILQRETEIAPDDTAGSLYFDRLFPMGVAALLDAAELAVGGDLAIPQDESAASYEGWCRGDEARINWNSHVDQIYNLIRGCNPVPGAWTLFSGKRLQLFDVRKHPTRRHASVRCKVGSVAALGDQGLFIAAHGGHIEILKVRYGEGEKTTASQFCTESGISLGALLGQ